MDLLTISYEIDHIKPLCVGGSNEENNLQALCRNCHGDKTMFEELNLFSSALISDVGENTISHKSDEQQQLIQNNTDSNTNNYIKNSMLTFNTNINIAYCVFMIKLLCKIMNKIKNT